jgi:hypothetical protein
LKQAAKIDTSSFKLGPKLLKAQTKPSVTSPRPPVQPASNSSLPEKMVLPTKPTTKKRSSPTPYLPSKSALDRSRSSASTSRSASPLGAKPSQKVSSPSINSAPVLSPSSSGKDAKSRIRESFMQNPLIPLGQGPRRDLRTIEEAQTDLWKKKGKTFPVVTGTPKETSRVPASVRQPVLPKKEAVPTPKVSDVGVKKAAVAPPAKPKKRSRDEDSESDRDSFIAYSDEEEEESSRHRAEIRAMFSRNQRSRIVDSDDDSDMEATGLEMEREEARAIRLAKLEDQLEEKRLEEHAKEKKKRKVEAQKWKSVK